MIKYLLSLLLLNGCTVTEVAIKYDYGFTAFLSAIFTFGIIYLIILAPQWILKSNTRLGGFVLLIIFFILMICGCSTTQYIPTQTIDVPCALPNPCAPLYIIQKNAVVYGVLQRKIDYLICKQEVDSYLECVKQKGN